MSRKRKFQDKDPLGEILSLIVSGQIQEIQQLLLNNGFDVNTIVDEVFILSIACESGRLDIVKLLIDSGADINLPSENPEVWTALMSSVLSGNKELVDFLIRSGADANEIRDGGNYALMIAAEEKHHEIFKTLATVTKNELKKEAEIRLSELTTKKKNDKRYRMLFDAIRRSDVKSINKFVQNNVNLELNIVDEFGFSPLVYASKKGKFEIVRMLLDLGADPNFNEEGIPPLMASIESGKLEIIELLLKSGANVNISCQGWTVMMQAKQYLRQINPDLAEKVIKLLIKYGANN